MMVTKLLILLFFIWLSRRIYLSLKTKPIIDTNKGEPTAHMVTCDTCGVYLPSSEAVFVSEHYYCCDSHIPQK